MSREENSARKLVAMLARFGTLVSGIPRPGFCLFWKTLRWSSGQNWCDWQWRAGSEQSVIHQPQRTSLGFSPGSLRYTKKKKKTTSGVSRTKKTLSLGEQSDTVARYLQR